jgi:hypothetical protein
MQRMVSLVSADQCNETQSHRACMQTLAEHLLFECFDVFPCMQPIHFSRISFCMFHYSTLEAEFDVLTNINVLRKFMQW